MSRIMNTNSNNKIPTPPPLPPPLKGSSSAPGSSASMRKGSSSLQKTGSGSTKSSTKIGKRHSQGSASNGSKRSAHSNPPSSSGSKPKVIHSPRQLQASPKSSPKPSRKGSSRSGSPPDPEVERNDVPFFDEEECIDPNDAYSFPCCVPPYSPRYPPNPRPHRDWNPSFLPTGTNIPDSINKHCRRCGREVYVAELYLSSRGAYHTECYKCCLCGKSLDSMSVAEFKGEVFCKGCYRRNFSTHGTGFGVGAGVLQTP